MQTGSHRHLKDRTTFLSLVSVSVLLVFIVSLPRCDVILSFLALTGILNAADEVD